MEYQRKYKKYKRKYITLKSEIDTTTGIQKKCTISETDKIILGHGGSTALIVISKDNNVYKIFTTYIFENSDEKTIHERIYKENKRVNNEISIYKLLTKNIIDTNISDHFVKYINETNCNNANELFKDCPRSYIDFLKLSNDKKTKICSMKYMGFPFTKLQENYRIVEIEYCDYNCSDFINELSKLPVMLIERYLDIFFFQIIYTLVATKKIYPYFSHNDLFMRNILGMKEKDNGNFYTYTFNKKNYYIPQKFFFPKISDFGMTNLNKEFHDVNLFKSSIKDLFNILYDIYNGGNLGSKSLSELCKDDQNKINFLKIYFGKYFNVNTIDEYILNSKSYMDWDWNNILDLDFLKSIEMKEPEYLLDGYFYGIFGTINKQLFHYKSV